MLSLEHVVPDIVTYRTMKVLGSGQSTLKYCLDDIYDPACFYVVLNHFDVMGGLERIKDAPMLFFAHDFHNHKFNPVMEKKVLRSFLKRDNVFTFLHDKDINHENRMTTIRYPAERLEGIQNLHFYEKAQSNISHFENSTNSLLGFSSTLHSALSLAIGNDFIDEVHLYGLDLYIYQRLKRFDNKSVGMDASRIFNANKILFNYILEKKKQLKIVFFN